MRTSIALMRCEMWIGRVGVIGFLLGAILLVACADDAGGATHDSGVAANGGDDASAAGDAGGTSDGGSAETCPGLPPLTDYAAAGPFDVKVISDAGPTGAYYLFRPDPTLGKDRFQHPIAPRRYGVSTTAAQ